MHWLPLGLGCSRRTILEGPALEECRAAIASDDPGKLFNALERALSCLNNHLPREILLIEEISLAMEKAYPFRGNPPPHSSVCCSVAGCSCPYMHVTPVDREEYRQGGYEPRLR